MKLPKLLDEAINIVKNSDLEEVEEIEIGLRKLRNWCCPDLDTDRLQKIVLCKDCVHCRKLRNKKTKQIRYKCVFKDEIVYPEYWCADGKEN